MSTCTPVPYIFNKNGEKVPSMLWTELAKHFPDRDELVNNYLATKIEAFKKWEAVSNMHDEEPQIFYEDRRPYFLNFHGERRYLLEEGVQPSMVFESDVWHTLETKGIVDVDGNLNEGMVEQLAYSNKVYREVYNLADNLFATKLQQDGTTRVTINRQILDLINGVKHPLLSPERKMKGVFYADEASLFDETPTESGDVTAAIVKFKEYKEFLLRRLEDRKHQVATTLRHNQNNPVRRQMIIRQKQQINSVITSLVTEIDDLDKLARQQEGFVSFEALDQYALTSLDRLNKLVESPYVEDIEEADELITFFKMITSLGPNNPLFTDIEVSKVLSTDDVGILNRWRATAESAERIVAEKKKHFLHKHLENLPQLKRFYGRTLTKEEIEDFLSKPMKDIGLVDAFFMDATNGVFSTNGILPQVASIELRNAFDRSKSQTIRFSQRIDALLPEVREILSKTKYKMGKEVSYEPFLQEWKGMKTGRITSRYTPDWDEAAVKAHSVYVSELHEANNVIVSEGFVGYASKDEAHEHYRSWRKNNTDIVNFMSLSEVADYVEQNKEFEAFGFRKSGRSLTAAELGISDRHYQELVKEQIHLLDDFLNHYRTFREDLLGGENRNEMTVEEARALDLWVREYSPQYGVASFAEETLVNNTKFMGQTPDGHKRLVFNTFDYNILIPKKSLGYWDENFDFLEQNDALYEMRNVLEEGYEYINNTVGSDKLILTEPKTIYEVMFANDDATLIARLLEVWEIVKERFFDAIGIVESDIQTYIDKTIEGKEIGKISNAAIKANKRKIRQRYEVEVARYTALLGIKIDRFTLVDVDDNPHLLHLANQHGFNPEEPLPLGRILYTQAANDVIYESSFNLPKTMLAYLNIAGEYNARQEVKPLIDLILNEYKNLDNIKTNNVDQPFVDENGQMAYTGKRHYAIRQIDDWYTRAVLGNYEEKHRGKFKGEKVYSKQEKELVAEIQNILNQKKEFYNSSGQLVQKPLISATQAENLNRILDTLGKAPYWSKSFLGLLKVLRFKGLGWNYSAQVTNYAEGQIANETMIAQTGAISYPSWYRASKVLNRIQLQKFTRQSDDPDVLKTKHLMDKLRVFMDAKNEFQKSLDKTSPSSLEKLNPYNAITTIEYLNQSPLMIGMLMDEKIMDKNGEEHSVWDAYDEQGMLKEGFQTEENLLNWEHLEGDQYEVFKNKLTKLVINTHGDYDKLSGMMVKSYLTGKALMMFKGWLPRALSVRFATEQDDIQMGTRIKGRYRSHTAVSAALHGGTLGLFLFGPVGALLGASTSYLAMNLDFVKHSFNGMSTSDRNAGLKAQAQELLTYAKIMFKRMYGIPVNRIMGEYKVEFDATEELMSQGFSELDARNLQATMQDISLIIGILIMSLVIKSLTWDDDDEQDDARRQVHNLLINKLNGLGDQASLVGLGESMTSISSARFIGDLAKTIEDTSKFLEGDDILKSGPYRGQSRLGRDINKLTMPTSANWFGFGSQRYQQFDHKSWDKLFWGDEKRITSQIRGQMAKHRKELRDSGKYTDKQINKMMKKYSKELKDEIRGR